MMSGNNEYKTIVLINKKILFVPNSVVFTLKCRVFLFLFCFCFFALTVTPRKASGFWIGCLRDTAQGLYFIMLLLWM